MSWKVESWLADNCNIEHLGKRFLLFSMANQANDEGRLVSKNWSYVKRMNVSERTIQRWTSDLVAEGWIQKIFDHSKDDGRQLSNAYQIRMPAPEVSETPSKGSKGGRVTELCHPPLTASVTGGVTELCHRGGDTHAVTPINQTENLTEKQRKTPPSPLTGGAAVENDRLAAAERTAKQGHQAIAERLWAEQGRQMTRKVSRAIRSRLRAGESVESVWADYFAPDETAGWDPPTSGEGSHAARLLSNIRTLLKGHAAISEHSWCTWIVPLRAVRYDYERNVLVVAAPSAHAQDWLDKNYGSALQAVAIQRNLAGIEYWRPGNSDSPHGARAK